MEEKKQKNRKIRLLIIVATIIVIATIVIATQLTKKNGEEPSIFDSILYSSDPYNASVDYKLFEPSSLNRSVARYAVTPVYNSLTDDYRPRWEGCTDEQYLQIFSELPSFPQDFYKKYQMFMLGSIVDYDRLTENYWKQPEFYDLDDDSFYNYMNRGFGMFTPGTISCKPSVRMVEMKKGSHVELSTFFHTTIRGSEAYLGAVFYAIYPEKALNSDGIEVFANPDNIKQYIHAKISGPENDPIFMTPDFQKHIEGFATNVDETRRMLLFAPTYSVVDSNGQKKITGFTDSWCQKVTLDITIDSNCPAGNYVVAIDMENPSESIIQEYNWVISSAPYYGFFLQAIREWRPDCPFFQVIITVM